MFVLVLKIIATIIFQNNSFISAGN